MVEIGKKYNMLTVLEFDHKDKNYGKYFRCKCDCGKETVVRSDKIESGHTKSCGCFNKSSHTNNLIGQKFGLLTVVEPTSQRDASGMIIWKCQCACGNFSYASGTDLRAGRYKSCGKCYKATDITGLRSGKLVALEPTKERYNGSVVWKCQCDCGNIHYVGATYLIRQQIRSCGCTISHGEDKITKILRQNNVAFKKQYTFDDLKDKQKLQFDFGILTNDNQLYCLVEYQGSQHYIEPSGNSAWTNPKMHDEMKRAYCKQHKIKLIEIPYIDFDKIDFNYLKERGCIPNVQSKTN